MSTSSDMSASPRHPEPMTSSVSADNMMNPSHTGGDNHSSSAPQLKRKIDDEGGVPTRPTLSEGKENISGGEKRQRIDLSNMPSSPMPGHASAPHSQPTASSSTGSGHPSGMAELVKGKLVLKQSAHTYEIPRRKKLAFEAFLLDVQEGKEKLEEGLPEEYHSVLVWAGQESSVLAEGHLINHIKKALDMKDLSDVIPASHWSELISDLFRLKQYGLSVGDLPSGLQSSVKKIPNIFQIRCWEARKPSKYFQDNDLALVRSRMAERAQVREEVGRLFKAMSEDELAELLNAPAKGGKAEIEKKAKDSPAPSMERQSREGTGASGRSGRSVSPVKKSKMTAEEEEATRVKNEERDAKRAAKELKRVEKEEKDAAKAAEIQKKEALATKQKQSFGSFFKPKVLAKPAMASKPNEAGPSRPAKAQVSDFDRVFKPITFRANVEWAPVNRFRYKRRSVTPEETKKASEEWPLSEHINHLVRKSGVRPSSGPKLPKGLKTAPLYGSVGEIWLEHQDAADPRKVLNRLKNRRKFPWKTLAFDGQVRPPYYGTFTKKSVVVGPRTPFAQDPMFDYSYDSGDDWEDDAGGEDVDDNANLEPEEQDEDDGEDEGEFDDWLDDSEDVVVEAAADGTPGKSIPIEVDGDEPVLMSATGLPVKVVKKKEVQPKRVVKVVPTWRGPLWEREIGEGHEGMEMYRIQLLNDTPDSINPFTYTSSEPIMTYRPTFSTVAIGHNLSVKTLLSVETLHQASIPPITMIPSASISAPGVVTPSAAIAPKSKPSGPRIAFPVTHLPEFLRLVDGNTSKRMPDLVSELRTHFSAVASKVAIEFKLKEVAVKEVKSKDTVWRVLPEAWIAVGIAPPPPPQIEYRPEPLSIDA